MAKLTLPSSDRPPASDDRTTIAYVLVRDDADHRRATTVFRLLPSADLYLLRCFMALALLPGDAARIGGTGRPFLDALARIDTLPQPRVVGSTGRPDPALWGDMERLPFVVLLVADALPSWAVELADARPIIVASQYDSVLRTTESLGSFAARLAGTQYLREFYAALQRLSAALADSNWSESNPHDQLSSVASGDLFEERSRLRFLPGLPLPPTDAGRSGCYLYNRLTNNVDDPTLTPTVTEESAGFYRSVFRWTLSACRLLAVVEVGLQPPGDIGVSAAELGEAYGKLLGELTDREKFDLLMRLGRRVSSVRPLPHLVAVPVPRRDIVRGRVPVGVDVEPGQKRWSGVQLRALRDLARGHRTSRPSEGHARRVYDRACETLLGEDRLISCAGATLAARLGAEPWQLGPSDAQVYNDVKNWHGAIGANSRKVSALFRRVEIELAGLFEAETLTEVAAGTSPVTFVSDLPLHGPRWTTALGPSGSSARSAGDYRWSRPYARADARLDRYRTTAVP